MKKVIATSFAALIAVSGAQIPAWSEESNLPEGLEEYQLTGETKNCVRTTRIRNTDIIDDNHIVFQMRNGDAYLNRLSDGCHQLEFEGTFSYKTSIAQLCQHEIIRVVDDSNQMERGACGLGEFEEIVEAES